MSLLRKCCCFAEGIGQRTLKTMEGDCLSCMKYLMFLFNFFIFVSIWNSFSFLDPSVSSSLLLPSRIGYSVVKLPQYRISSLLCTGNH